MNESLFGRIFISYRRQETAWPAGRLYDVLVEHFPTEQVFKDVDNIEPGEDFVERITAAVGSCDVLLALIGPQWLTITDENGQRRLDNPEDYVRLEIETALKRKIRVIPILVDDARMPRANQLPATLAPLVRRNAVEINPLTFDTKRLISTVHNPFVGSRPLNGLLVILLMFNSSDLKESNNSQYEFAPPGAGRTERWFVVRDLGTALGTTARITPLRGDLEAFERLGFITRVANGFVEFDYRGLHPELFDRRITPDDVFWAARLLAGVSDAQWQDAFRAGGYAPAVSARFIAKVKSKIADGLALAPTERF